MKNLRYIIMLLVGAVVVSSCEMNLDPLTDTDNRISIVFNPELDSVTNYTFAYYESDFVLDTVFIDVTAVGFVVDYDRKISLTQTTLSGDDDEGTPFINAKAGVHYIPFDDEKIADRYVVKAGETGAKLPIILLRDASLRDDIYTLQVTIEENDDFKLLSSINSTKRIRTSDILLKPDAWSGMFDYYLNGYGTEKHRVMNQAVYERSGAFVNDEWLTYMNSNQAEFQMWMLAFDLKLSEINAERKAANGGVDDPLREGAEYGNIIVAF